MTSTHRHIRLQDNSKDNTMLLPVLQHPDAVDTTHNLQRAHNTSLDRCSAVVAIAIDVLIVILLRHPLEIDHLVELCQLMRTW